MVEFNIPKTDSGDYIKIHHEWKDLKPKSGWDNFLTTLNNYQIANLKSGKSFDNQKEVLTEMSYVQFEIAHAGRYRFYEYLEPSFYRYVDSGSNNIYNFLTFFNKEMNIQIYNPDESLFVKPKK